MALTNLTRDRGGWCKRGELHGRNLVVLQTMRRYGYLYWSKGRQITWAGVMPPSTLTPQIRAGISLRFKPTCVQAFTFGDEAGHGRPYYIFFQVAEPGYFVVLRVIPQCPDCGGSCACPGLANLRMSAEWGWEAHVNGRVSRSCRLDPTSCRFLLGADRNLCRLVPNNSQTQMGILKSPEDQRSGAPVGDHFDVMRACAMCGDFGHGIVWPTQLIM